MKRSCLKKMCIYNKPITDRMCFVIAHAFLAVSMPEKGRILTEEQAWVMAKRCTFIIKELKEHRKVVGSFKKLRFYTGKWGELVFGVSDATRRRLPGELENASVAQLDKIVDDVAVSMSYNSLEYNEVRNL